MKPSPQSFDGAVLIRWALFFVVLLALSWLHVFLLFRGLGTPEAMDQAQLARQVSRGEGLATKSIRPLEYHLAEDKAGRTVPLVGLEDTYHAPLNPLVLGAVFKLVGADQEGAFEMGGDQVIYELDRVVAFVSTLFFLMAIGVTYLLVSRIFDARIAGVTGVLMLLCNLFWQFSQSGLPQMLLLLLFTCGLYFCYRAVENQNEGRSPLAAALTAAVFFTLMVLSHWVTAWIFIGFLLFVALALRPRGIIALSALAILAIGVAFPIYRMIEITGEPFGVARFVFYNGLAGGSEDQVMRTFDLGATPLVMDGVLVKIVGTTLVQATDIIPFLGGILAAPVFFIALLHPFKRKPIADFRWLIALMWVFAALGMAIFGVSSSEETHPNQIHILFAPIMAAYGLAMLSILWSRLEIVNQMPVLRYAHYVVIVALSAAPLLLTLPRSVQAYLHHGAVPQWPPYYPQILNRGLANWVETDTEQPEVVMSDQPWAVAWYADAHSIWLPRTMEGFTELDRKANNLGTPLAGTFITPSSRENGSSMAVKSTYGDFAALVLDGRVATITGPNPERPGFHIYDKAGSIAEIYRRFPYRYPLLGQEIIYYSANPIEDTQLGD